MRVEGVARIVRLSNIVEKYGLSIPKNIFVVIAGLGKSEAMRYGYRAYMAPTSDGCIRLAVSRSRPVWAQYTTGIGSIGVIYLPRSLVKELNLSPGHYRIVVEKAGDDRHAVICR